MKGLNKALIMGNATADPTYQTTQGGHAVASLSIATNETFTDANGQKQDRAEFHRVVFWDKLADIVRQYIHKGSPLYIEGKIRTRKYTDNNGIEKYVTEIVANELVMLGGGNGTGNNSAGNPAQNSGQYSGNNYGNNGNNGNYGGNNYGGNNSGGNGRYNNQPNIPNGQYNGGNYGTPSR